MSKKIVIRSRQKNFRRCGVAHSCDPAFYDLNFFTKEQLKALQQEKMLIVEIKEVENKTEDNSEDTEDNKDAQTEDDSEDTEDNKDTQTEDSSEDTEDNNQDKKGN